MTQRPELRAAVGAIRALYSAAATSCAIIDESGERLRYVASDGAGADRIVGVTLPVGRGIAGFVAMSGQAIGVADVQRDPRFARDVAESTDYVPRTIVAVPMLDEDGEVSGVLSVLDPAVDATSGWSLSVLGAFGTVVGQLAAGPNAGQATSTVQEGSDLERLTAQLSARGPAGQALVTEVLGALSTFLDERGR